MTTLVEIPVEYSPGSSTPVLLLDEILREFSTAPDLHQKLVDLLKYERRVPDAWRYDCEIEDDDGEVCAQFYGLRATRKDHKLKYSNYHDDIRAEFAEKVILILLESPHVDEYFLGANQVITPRGPAQKRRYGGAGHGLEKHGAKVLEQLGLPSGIYAVVIANPVPYHCSLGLLKPGEKIKNRVRDHVWTRLWSLDFVRSDFIARCKQYAPAAILNCCTENLQSHVSLFLGENGYGRSLFEAYHPSSWDKYFAKRNPVQVRRVEFIAAPPSRRGGNQRGA